MKMMTKEIIDKLPALYSNENIKPEDVDVIVKFFCPWNGWTWYVTEGEQDKSEDDWLFFGMVHGLENELGYFRLSELEEVRGPGGLKIERDMYYSGNKLSEVM